MRLSISTIGRRGFHDVLPNRHGRGGGSRAITRPLTRLRAREIDGVIVKGVYDGAACKAGDRAYCWG
jgi:hypothetical protein